MPGESNLRKVVVDVGASEQLSVVTNAPNIRDKTRTAVAMIGTEFELNGQTITVAKTHVGGVLSEGIICDSTMLGWAGGSAGNCVQISAE